MTIYSLGVLLSQILTSPLFPAWFELLLLDPQVSQQTGKVVWYSHLLKNFPVCCDPHKGFNIVKEAEVDVFLEFPCFLYNPVNVGNLISCSFAFSETSLDAWKFLVHVMQKSSMQDFVCDLTSMGDKSSCLVVWTSWILYFLGAEITE